MELAEIAGHPELAPTLARWHADEWGHLYRSWDYDAAVAEFLAMDVAGHVPTTWIAFGGSGRSATDVLGSVSIIDDDELDGYRDVGPWLASLYVVPGHRGEGLGTALVRVAVEGARALGIERLHLFTAGQEPFYRALGWRTIGHADAEGEDAAVMVLDTAPHAARHALATRWCTDPDVAGAYSYLRTGGTAEHRDVLAGAIGPGLRLAGEATWRSHPGTMHGAWFSGERAAADLLTELGPTSRVTVVGAGLAGLAAARALGEAGAGVVVLEAAGEPGGRIRSSDALGGAVNLGAAWIHGEIGNPLTPLADAAGIARATGMWDRTTTFVAGRGELAPADGARLARTRDDIDARLAERAAVADVTDALGPALRAELAACAPHEGDRVVLGCWLRGEYENLYAGSLDELSLAHCAEPFRMDGDDGMLLGAAGALAREMAARLDVRYGSPAREIVRLGSGEWEVRTPVETLRSDGVIVTVPIGALQGGRITFDPPLPDLVRTAIERIGAGRVAKAFFTFDDAFWSPHRAFWIAGDPPVALELWVDVTALVGRPALCAFATGDHAIAIETMTEDELARLGTEVLRVGQVVGAG